MWYKVLILHFLTPNLNQFPLCILLEWFYIFFLPIEYLPSLVGFATIGSQALRQKFDFFNFNEPWLNQRFFGVQLNVPIWDSYSRKRTIQGVQVGIKQIEMTREIMLDGYEIQFENAKTELITAYDAYISYESNIQLAEKYIKPHK